MHTFPHLAVRYILDKGWGVVARRRLVPGMWIRVEGLPTTEPGTHVFDVGGGQWVDAHPSFDTFNHVGGAGRFIAGMVNEPTTGGINVLLRRGYLLIIRSIEVGVELVTCYGNVRDYTRDYKVSKSCTRKK